MKTLPLVSVHCVSYNQIAYIDEAIRSAVGQDYDNLEVIVCDDGSTDGTAERIREWAERYPGRVVPVLGPHVGITANCNRIMPVARGKYIFHHAGDDVYLPGKVTKQVEWLEEDERRVMCGHAVEGFDAATGKALYLTTDTRPLVRGRGARRMIEQFGLLPEISMAVRRSAYPPGGYDERVGVVSAMKLNIDILANGGEYGYVDGVLARYRVHPQSLGRRSNFEPEMHRQFLEGYLIALAIVEANHPHLVASCRKVRARLLFSEARWHQYRHEREAARHDFAAAARDNPALVLKAAAGYALTFLPASISDRFAPRGLPKRT
jgi:glycosyltransferase involved in cell wall biosynthesis